MTSERIAQLGESVRLRAFETWLREHPGQSDFPTSYAFESGWLAALNALVSTYDRDLMGAIDSIGGQQ